MSSWTEHVGPWCLECFGNGVSVSVSPLKGCGPRVFGAPAPWIRPNMGKEAAMESVFWDNESSYFTFLINLFGVYDFQEEFKPTYR